MKNAKKRVKAWFRVKVQSTHFYGHRIHLSVETGSWVGDWREWGIWMNALTGEIHYKEFAKQWQTGSTWKNLLFVSQFLCQHLSRVPWKMVCGGNNVKSVPFTKGLSKRLARYDKTKLKFNFFSSLTFSKKYLFLLSRSIVCWENQLHEIFDGRTSFLLYFVICWNW